MTFWILGPGLHRGGEDLAEEGALRPGGVQGGEGHVLGVVPGLPHQRGGELHDGGPLLVAEVLHLDGGDGHQHLKGGGLGGLHTLPGLGDAVLAHPHAGHHGGGGDHGGDGLVGEHIGFPAVGDGGQLDPVHVEPVQGPGQLNALLKAQRRGGLIGHLSERDVCNLNGLHRVSPSLMKK